MDGDCLTMTLDHANRTVWPFQGWACLPWAAWPSLCLSFSLAYNLTVRHVPFQRYLLPLLVFGAVSQLPAMIASWGGALSPSTSSLPCF